MGWGRRLLGSRRLHVRLLWSTMTTPPKDGERVMEYDKNSLEPTRFLPPGTYTIYDQEGNLVTMRCADTLQNRMFAVWLRKFDRY